MLKLQGADLIAAFHSRVGLSGSGLWAQLDDGERRQEGGGYTALKFVEKLVCTCLGFPLCCFIPVRLDAWGRAVGWE